MMKKLSYFAVFALMSAGCATQTKTTDVASYDSFTADRAPAEACENGKDWNCKRARKNDAADQYMLDNNGNFYRYFKASKQTCQITSNVKDFKISQHPNDAAVAYYESNNNLFVVHPQGTASGNCPPVSKKQIMANVKEWKLVSNQNTTIVNANSDDNGRFEAWDNRTVVYSQNDVIDFQMNQCYGSAGKSFNSYVLFTLNRFGDVNKVKVEGNIFRSDDSKVQRGNWRNLTEWKKEQRVCE